MRQNKKSYLILRRCLWRGDVGNTQNFWHVGEPIQGQLGAPYLYTELKTILTILKSFINVKIKSFISLILS